MSLWLLCVYACSTLCCYTLCLVFFFFNDTATTEIYTLSLHDALPILIFAVHWRLAPAGGFPGWANRSEEHTSELQSRQYLVCRLLLEKKKNTENRKKTHQTPHTLATLTGLHPPHAHPVPIHPTSGCCRSRLPL